MWAAARMCQINFKPVFKTTVPVLKSTLVINLLDNGNSAKHQCFRKLTSSRNERIFHAVRRSKLKEASPEAAFTVGRAVTAGAGIAGVGALCFYGLGLSKREGIVERAAFWPQYVKDRIATTYMYVGSSILVATAAATASFSSPTIMRIFTGGLLPNLLMCGALMAGSMILHSIPYSPGIGPKQIGWFAFSSLLGTALAPLCFYGGPILLRAAWYTVGIVGGLSAVAICAPNDQFLRMAGPLAVGAGFVFVSGLGSMFLPSTTLLGASLHSVFLYGGLVLFSGMLLHNSQAIAKQAESCPPDLYGASKYDPINMSMLIFMDIVNIFVRVVTMVGSSRKN